MITPGQTDKLFLRYWERRDWLVSVGCCAPCAMGLSLEPIAVSLSLPLLMPCALPKWRGQKCVELARAAWASRTAPQQKEAA